jgi:hypothetical protein
MIDDEPQGDRVEAELVGHPERVGELGPTARQEVGDERDDLCGIGRFDDAILAPPRLPRFSSRGRMRL